MKLQLRKNTPQHFDHIPETIDAPQPEVVVETDPKSSIRFGMLVLLLGFGGFLIWALFAPLDAGVPAPGVVSVESQRKTVQHLTGGIVEKILVKEGDTVKAGQVLVVLNPVQAKAQLGITRGQYLSARAMESRLMAEYERKGAIDFHPDLLKEKDDPGVAEIMEVQSRLFATRRLSQQRELAVLRESAAALETQLKGMRELAKEGYVPRNKMLDMERSYAEIRLRILQQEQEYRKQVETQLSDVQKEVSAQHSRLVAVQDELNRTEVKAPSDGVVVGLAVHTIGGVISPGSRIMDIVPQDEPLIVDAQISPHLIDLVKPGLEAELRFTAFNQSSTPVISGTVATVSADSLTDPATHQPYYSARITVSQKELQRLGSNQIQPGMPVEAIMKTGSRTLMNYLLKPLVDRFAISLRER
jgi:type I secretion membrane fusion protein, HlyD family